MLILGTVGRTIIEVEGLSLGDAGAKAPLLDGVNLQVARREVLSVVNHDVATGKALISVLGGVRQTWEGQVKVIGRELGAWGPELHERIGVSFAQPNQHRTLTVRENLEYRRGLYRVRTRAPLEVLRWFGLESKIDAPASVLDEGELQCLSLACSLIHEPELWLIERPYPSERLRTLLLSVIQEQRSFGTTIVVATQDLEWANSVGDRVIRCERQANRARACA